MVGSTEPAQPDSEVLAACPMFCRIAVVFDVAWLACEDGMVTAHIAVLAGKPMGTTLAKDDVAGDDVLLYEEKISMVSLQKARPVERIHNCSKGHTSGLFST